MTDLDKLRAEWEVLLLGDFANHRIGVNFPDTRNAAKALLAALDAEKRKEEPKPCIVERLHRELRANFGGDTYDLLRTIRDLEALAELMRNSASLARIPPAAYVISAKAAEQWAHEIDGR
jgi:hypothetical protein